MKEKWSFWIDCGGTFTDIIAVSSGGKHKVHKLLSHSKHYESAVVQGITDLLGHQNFKESIEELRLGTTVATNAFLERNGVPCALITTLGHRDVLEIRNQNRQNLFDLDIKKVAPLYSSASSIEGRMNAKGEILKELNEEIARFELQRILDNEIKSIAISLLHSTINPAHEIRLREIALEMGFEYVSLSHEVSPIGKYVARTETAVIDSYLSPYLKQYTEDLEKKLDIPNIYYMQSDGGLCKGSELKGHNALLSGPAGGLIGAIDIAKAQGREKIITFDMGGTSTDVAIYDRELSINPTPDFYGLKLLCPMVDIHTVAAGGGSILKYDNGRFQVGPNSAGAFPGPACYRNNGPLTVTDANLFLGRIEVEKFPHIFGENQDLPLDKNIVEKKFKELEKEIGLSAKEIAEGFIDVAVETMSRAIRKVSIERGHDPKDFCLVSFGGAAGQLAIKVAQTLGINEVLIHPHSSVLSAFGMGKAYHQKIATAKTQELLPSPNELATGAFLSNNSSATYHFLMRARGSDHEVEITAIDLLEAKERFSEYHERTFGHAVDEIETVSVSIKLIHNEKKELFFDESPLTIEGEKILSENNTSIIVESGWQAHRNNQGLWTFKELQKAATKKRDKKIELEIFYQRFQFIAEQMGTTLQRLAHSINIKERNDFSCAIFSADCELIANAPHIPVHLGSMDQAVKSVSQNCEVKPGESYILNSPTHGGTHLPDVTIITPVFFKDQLMMWVASRGHHADIGGITPGSMPGNSKLLEEEGVIIPPTRIFSQGKLEIEKIESILTKAKFPVRNLKMNLHDIKAKISANHKGEQELINLASLHSIDHLKNMSEEILDYTHHKIHSVLQGFKDISIKKQINNERHLQVTITQKEDKTIFDFSGSSPLLENNFNAPKPVVNASVMFALRSLLKENIPLNSGVLRAIEIEIPKDSMLNPQENSPVVAGNVETSQAICDIIFQALAVKENSYGSMNNLSLGNHHIQYYETICGGSGATESSNGASAVQVNMTDSLLTDPEVFESRLPILIELMSIRHGSGGNGHKIGGDGVYRRLLFLEEMGVNLITQSRQCPPLGLKDGKNAQRGLNQIEDQGYWKDYPECFSALINNGQRLSISTPGGGGYGAEADTNNNLIFGFGSNMDINQIKKRCPSAKLICRATVKNKEIRYTTYSRIRLGGVADMFEAPGHEVLGLVVSINDQDLSYLDKIECDDNGYQRIEIEAFDDNGEALKCFAYDVIDKKPDVPPTAVYEWLVYSGAFYLNAPHSYLEKIRSYRI